MLLQLVIDHLANRANLADPYGMFGRHVLVCMHYVRHEYRLRRLQPRRLEMRANYPNVRLNIKGESTVH